MLLGELKSQVFSPVAEVRGVRCRRVPWPWPRWPARGRRCSALCYDKNTSENSELYVEFNLHGVLKLAETVTVNYVQLIHKELCAQIYEYAVPHGINYVRAFACSDH